MLKQTLIAAATAGLIGLGMAATTTSASAAGSVQFGGPGWNVQIGTGQYDPDHQFRPGNFCKPIVKNVKWWDRHGYPHWSQVVVGQSCPPPKFPPHNYNPGPFPPHGGHWGGHGPGWGW